MTWNLSCEQFFWSMMQTKLTITNQFKMPACYFWLKNGTRKKFTNANQWNDWNLDAFYFNCIRTSSLEIALYTKYLVCTYDNTKKYILFFANPIIRLIGTMAEVWLYLAKTGNAHWHATRSYIFLCF